MGWLVALVVWTAAGARIGRVAARQPTPLRVAMVVAVSSAALASTLAVPDVAGRLDTVAPDVGLSEIILELAWTLFAAASAVGAISVWPILPRPALRAVAVIVYTVAIVLGIGLAGGYPVPALVFIAIALTAVVVTGARHVAWTPLGRGISLIVVGSAIVLAAAVVGLVREVSGETWAVGSSPAYTVAAVIVSVGTVWVLVETWFRARQDLRRMNTLHSVLVSRFPEVVEGDGKGARPSSAPPTLSHTSWMRCTCRRARACSTRTNRTFRNRPPNAPGFSPAGSTTRSPPTSSTPSGSRRPRARRRADGCSISRTRTPTSGSRPRFP